MLYKGERMRRMTFKGEFEIKEMVDNKLILTGKFEVEEWKNLAIGKPINYLEIEAHHSDLHILKLKAGKKKWDLV